jgi:hypothetical protein
MIVDPNFWIWREPKGTVACSGTLPDDIRYPEGSRDIVFQAGQILFDRDGRVRAWWDEGEIERRWLANNRARFMETDLVPIPEEWTSMNLTPEEVAMLNDPPLKSPLTWLAAVRCEASRSQSNALKNHFFTEKAARAHLTSATKAATLAADSAALRLIADILSDAKNFVAAAAATGNTNAAVEKAIVVVARRLRRIPTQDEVWQAIPQQAITTRRGLDKVLTRMGFCWLPKKASDLEDWLSFVRAQPLRPVGWNGV